MIGLFIFFLLATSVNATVIRSSATVRNEHSFLEAVKVGDVSLVKSWLKKGMNPNVDDQHSDLPALTIAAQKGNGEIVALLLDNGAFANVTDRSGMGGITPLISAVTAGQIEIAKLLLAWGANPNIGYAYGGTPLMIAAANGRKDIIDLLLEYHSDINLGYSCGAGHCGVYSAEGKTALMFSIEKGHEELARYLIERGANVSVVHNLSGAGGATETALELAEQRNFKALAALIRKMSTDGKGGP